MFNMRVKGEGRKKKNIIKINFFSQSLVKKIYYFFHEKSINKHIHSTFISCSHIDCDKMHMSAFKIKYVDQFF